MGGAQASGERRGRDCHDDRRREESHARESKLALAACESMCAYVYRTIHSLEKTAFSQESTYGRGTHMKVGGSHAHIEKEYCTYLLKRHL
jgi:hypothetical protein